LEVRGQHLRVFVTERRKYEYPDQIFKREVSSAGFEK